MWDDVDTENVLRPDTQAAAETIAFSGWRNSLHESSRAYPRYECIYRATQWPAGSCPTRWIKRAARVRLRAAFGIVPVFLGCALDLPATEREVVFEGDKWSSKRGSDGSRNDAFASLRSHVSSRSTTSSSPPNMTRDGGATDPGAAAPLRDASDAARWSAKPSSTYASAAR